MDKTPGELFAEFFPVWKKTFIDVSTRLKEEDELEEPLEDKSSAYMFGILTIVCHVLPPFDYTLAEVKHLGIIA